MKIYNEIKTVFIEESLVQKARLFAEQVAPTVNYSDSNQYINEKIKKDHFISKIGEEAARKVFQNIGKRVVGPDYNIYNRREKSWKSDLFIDGWGLAVKTQSQSSAKNYGISWLFQDSERHDTILDEPEAWVVFVECEDNFNCHVHPPYQMKELILKEPVLSHLKGKKKAVYKCDLPKPPVLNMTNFSL